MLTALYVIALVAAFFWVGLYLGRGYRPARPSLDFALPPGARLFRAAGPPRRTERVDLAVPIIVEGVDADGEAMKETTLTKTISGYGAAIILTHTLKPGQEVTLHRSDNSRHAVVRVLHELSRSPEIHVYGVTFVDPTADLWGACQLLTEAMEAKAKQAAAETKENTAVDMSPGST